MSVGFDDLGFKPGEKVRYIGNYRRSPEGEPGIIKSIAEDKLHAFVVYSCGGDWKNYQNYTGVRTKLIELKPGWNETDTKTEGTDKDNREDSI